MLSMRILDIIFLIIVGSFVISSCDFLDKPSTLTDKTDKTDELIVIAVNGHDTFYKNYKGENVGLEFELASEFAKELGKKIKFIIVSDVDTALLYLERNQGHMIVGGSFNNLNQERISFGPVYQKVQPQIAYNTNFPKPKSIRNLEGKNIEIASGTVYADQLNKEKLKVPGLRWTEMNTSADDLLARLSKGKNDYVIADSIQISIQKNFYTNLGVAINLGEEKVARHGCFHPIQSQRLRQKRINFLRRLIRMEI